MRQGTPMHGTRGPMGKRIAALLAATALANGCARSVPLARRELEWLRTISEIPVVYRTSPSPWVDCPGDTGPRAWSRDGNSSTIWDQFQNQRTASLRSAPPTDPARATGDRFLSLLHAAPNPLPVRERPLPAESVDLQTLSRQFGSAPVLVFETTRWVLAGCWYSYQPWFQVRATLLDLASGRVVWRDSCCGLFPPDQSREATPSELEANGKALYARMIEERAGRCASELFTRTLWGGR